jgi:YHS domain-containing protein
MIRLFAYLFDLIVAFFLARLVNRVLRQFFGTPQSTFRSPGKRARTAPEREAVRGEMARDPVCGMFVSTDLSPSHRLSQGGQTLHFCSQECLERYQRREARRSGTTG